MKRKEKLMLGDNIELLKKLPDNSIDSVVTDPPYGISFMGKKWDYDVPSVELWKEVMRVLKPGGHLLSACGTRTYHRMVVNIEDAGFEIRDMIDWVYGSGFPKSHNIGKAYDKKMKNDREVVDTKHTRVINGGKGQGAAIPGGDITYTDLEITKGTSQYEGWGTALKPAHENFCLARKPLEKKTIVDNVIEYGTGGINIDGCRIGEKDGRFPANIIFDEEAGRLLDEQSGESKSGKNGKRKSDGFNKSCYGVGVGVKEGDNNGEYGDKGGASRFFYCAKVSKKERNYGCEELEDVEKVSLKSSGSFCIKCGKRIDYKCGCNAGYELKEQTNNSKTTKNIHPTVKPKALMAYLCRLITPVGGIVLDPYMGSGSTGIAAIEEGFRFVGMEMDEEYFKIATARIQKTIEDKK